MPKLVLFDSGEQVLKRWMFEAGKNKMGHLTLKEPVHLAHFIMQLQEALDRDEASYTLTKKAPYPCEFCGRACKGPFCTERCKEGADNFPPQSKVIKEVLRCDQCRFYRAGIQVVDGVQTMDARCIEGAGQLVMATDPPYVLTAEEAIPPERCPLRKAEILVRLKAGL